VITATDNNGNVLTLVANGTINAQTGVRWDNVAPALPAGSDPALVIAGVTMRINTNPNGRFGNWINDAVTFNSTSTTKATSNGWLCVNPAGAVGTCVATDTLPRDAGVGGTTYYVSVGATKAAAYAAAPITSSATLAASATNVSYCAIAGAADALGNKTTLTAAQQATACGAEPNSTTFGVDRVAPVVGYGAAAIAANARISTATIGGEEIVTFADTGLVGNSGMNPATPVIASLQTRNTGAVTCLAGTLSSGACTLSATGMTTTVATGSSTTAVGGTSLIAYYTFNATATDAAGNSASVSPRVFVFDNTAPVVGAANTPVSVSGSAGFNASGFVSEDLDIQSYFWTVTYGTLPVGYAPTLFAQGGVTQVNGFNANPFINTNYVASSAVTLPLAWQADASVVAQTLYPLSGVQLNATNQGNKTAAGAAGAPTTVTPGTAISLTGFTSYPADFLPAGITGLSSGVTTAATAAAPLNSTLSATAVGLTATFNNPFSRVDFYAQNIGATQWVLIGSVATPSLVDIGGNRTFTWALPVNGAALYAQLGYVATASVNVMGIGMGASNGAIGMIPAAVFALNIVK
jgi:hypothetical protein